MVWKIFVPDTLSKSTKLLNSYDFFTSEFNCYSTELDAEKYQLYVEIATDILQTQNKDQLKALKNFLKTLPSPKDIEAVLTEAVNQLAEIDRDTYYWVLKHPERLMPELDLANII